MELSVTPAGSLRLWQASSEADDEAKNVDEPGMQAGQWGAAARVTSGVRSNVTLDSGRCQLHFRCSLLPTVPPVSPKKIPQNVAANAQIEVLHALSASTVSVKRQRDYALRFLALFPCFIHREFSAIVFNSAQIRNAARSLFCQRRH